MGNPVVVQENRHVAGPQKGVDRDPQGILFILHNLDDELGDGLGYGIPVYLLGESAEYRQVDTEDLNVALRRPENSIFVVVYRQGCLIDRNVADRREQRNAIDTLYKRLANCVVVEFERVTMAFHENRVYSRFDGLEDIKIVIVFLVDRVDPHHIERKLFLNCIRICVFPVVCIGHAVMHLFEVVLIDLEGFVPQAVDYFLFEGVEVALEVLGLCVVGH
jgi:hypothetical protein